MVLHGMAGLAACRFINRQKFGVLIFHHFREPDLPYLKAICGHLASRFEPMPLSAIVNSIENQTALPSNAITVTVDDGYRDFLVHGHPIFHKYGIPTTVFVVAGFADGRLWLWHDQINHALLNTSRKSIRLALGHRSVEFDLSTDQSRAKAFYTLCEELKAVPNDLRLNVLAQLGKIKDIEIPPEPPANWAALNWGELRALASLDVEIGCHTDSHPILSRLANWRDLDREIRGAKKLIEEKIGKPVRHFAYPNGRFIDIGPAAIRSVREAGYRSAVTCDWGLNSLKVEQLQIRRIPLNFDTEFRYAVESLAGLHLRINGSADFVRSCRKSKTDSCLHIHQ